MVQRLRAFVVALNLATILLWGWYLLEFLARGRFDVPRAVADVYLLVLTFYAGDKELHRWRHRDGSRHRHGELFVIGWAVTLLLMLGIEVLGGAEHRYRIPSELSYVVAGVLIIFFLTEYLKAEFHRRG